MIAPWVSPQPADLRMLRERFGLTQEEAGALVCSARRTWQDWETGRRKMSPGLWELFKNKTARREVKLRGPLSRVAHSTLRQPSSST